MALAVYHPPPLDVGPPPPPSRRLTSARRRLARLRSSPAREALEVARQLEANGFAVLDGFLGAAAMGSVRDELEGRALCDSGGAASGQVRSGRVSALRSDVSRWQRVDGSGGRVGLLRPLDLLANRTDGLVAALRDHAGSAPLAGTHWRSADAMLACYPPNGTRYVRHLDNVCSGGTGARCNGRRATAVYYLNPPAEDPTHGALRLFSPGLPTSPPLADIEPHPDHLALFLSDERVPHAVLPTGPSQTRLAVTLWYFDAAEEAAAAADNANGEGRPRLSRVAPHAGFDDLGVSRVCGLAEELGEECESELL
eukprot:CAMPEP_0185424476 /NCGR_PEP_ID=MMETSP1365-20130426/13250_1 /TAXON_ID=38817 /ORGANISM="Gephyrocapsa oceanica, Strain RCC1303" /LENGTH=310 /DNA_ID=CAMNT_0028028409 /DNA_START=90 /DNA_END=1022 /DNA_ORIENTATION=+